jgi:P4 family phage/plasmid primase-like protien
MSKRIPKSAEHAADPHALARSFVREIASDSARRPTLRYWRSEWWQHHGGHYSARNQDTIENAVTRFIRERFTKSGAMGRDGNLLRVSKGLVANTMNALKSDLEVAEHVERPVWLGPGDPGEFFAFSNGLVSANALIEGTRASVRDHTPEWFSNVVFDYPFEKDATCPRWLAFLNEVLEQDVERIALVQEWFGYVLRHDVSQQQFLVLDGDGDNGKSVVLGILTALLGPANVSHVPLEKFEGRFNLHSTLGKLANICTEVGEVKRIDEGTLKSFTAGDRMEFDRKFLPSLQAYPTARLILATNNTPRFADRSSGIWRRMTLMPFRFKVPAHQKDRKLSEKLRAELPGIFNWSLEGLRRLERRGEFTASAECNDALDVHRAESNPARVFLTEQYQVARDAFTKSDDLYTEYAFWCRDHGHTPLNGSQFGQEVKRAYPSAVRKRRQGKWGYEGIRSQALSPVEAPLHLVGGKEVIAKQ